MLLFCFLPLHNLFAIVDDYSLEAGADTLTCQVVVAVSGHFFAVQELITIFADEETKMYYESSISKRE